MAAQFVTEVVLNVSPSDEALQAMKDCFSMETVFAILLVATSYMALARVAAVGRVELDGEPVSGFQTASDRPA